MIFLMNRLNLAQKYEINSTKRSYYRKNSKSKSSRRLPNLKTAAKKKINFAAWEVSMNYEHVVQAIGRNRKVIAQKFKLYETRGK